MKREDIKLWQQVTHVMNDHKAGIVTGILVPDDQGIRVCWETLTTTWNRHEELELRPPSLTKPCGFNPKP